MSIDNSLNNDRIVNWWREKWSIKASEWSPIPLVLITTQRRIKIEAMLTKHSTLSNTITNLCQLITTNISNDHPPKKNRNRSNIQTLGNQ